MYIIFGLDSSFVDLEPNTIITKPIVIIEKKKIVDFNFLFTEFNLMSFKYMSIKRI